MKVLSSGGLSIIEYADAYVLAVHRFIRKLVEFMVLGFHIQASQAPAGPVSANALLNSSANFQLTSVSESQFEDISGGFPLCD